MGTSTKYKRLFIQHQKESGFLFFGSKKPLYAILVITYLIFTIFAAKNYYLGHKALAISLLLFVVLASIDTFAIGKGKALPINLNIVVSALVLSLYLSLYYLGVGIIYWIYPISIALIYLLSLRAALLFNLALFVIGCGFSISNMDAFSAFRVSLSLLITILMSSLIEIHINMLHQNLADESVRDPMTGALNRRQLSTYLDASLANKKRNHVNSAILMFDIDHFKQINDNFGHDVGDKVIKEIVAIIDQNSREVDMLFRVGGEEFILLMNDIEILDAHNFAEKLRKIIEASRIIENHPITVSVGISKPFQNLSSNTWMKNADIALYEAKTSGRNQVRIHASNDS